MDAQCFGKCSHAVMRRMAADGEVNVLVRLVPMDFETDLAPGGARMRELETRFNEHAEEVVQLILDAGSEVKLLPLANTVASRVGPTVLTALGKHKNVKSIELDERANILQNRR